MKKIVLASAAMGGAALVAFGASGTFAAFSDSQTRESDPVATGTLLLEAGDVIDSSAFDASNLAPGQSVTYTSYVQNAGTLPGRLTNVFELSEDRELPGCNDNEAAVDATCGTSGISDGELAEASQMTVYYGVVSDASVCDAGARPGSELTRVPRSINGSQLYVNQTLAPGQGFCTVYVISIPATAGNEIQSDNLRFRAKYQLDQVV